MNRRFKWIGYRFPEPELRDTMSWSWPIVFVETVVADIVKPQPISDLEIIVFLNSVSLSLSLSHSWNIVNCPQFFPIFHIPWAEEDVEEEEEVSHFIHIYTWDELLPTFHRIQFAISISCILNNALSGPACLSVTQVEAADMMLSRALWIFNRACSGEFHTKFLLFRSSRIWSIGFLRLGDVKRIVWLRWNMFFNPIS